MRMTPRIARLQVLGGTTRSSPQLGSSDRLLDDGFGGMGFEPK